MDLKELINDSIETSVTLKLFKNKQESAYAHIYKSTYVMFPMSKCEELDNFNAELRLSDTPYPPENRPRGKADLDSVKHNRKLIRTNGHTEPIWIAMKGKKYILLDGAHRLVATHLENKRTIPCYIIKV